jgi:Fe2+ transport system protein B
MSIKLSDLPSSIQAQIAEKYTVQKESKYHNRKTAVDGIMFDSKHEADRWLELKLLERAGVIQNLQRQVKFDLYPSHETAGVKIRAKAYIADFVYTENGNQVVEDAKGVRTREYKNKRRMMKQRYGIEISEV